MSDGQVYMYGCPTPDDALNKKVWPLPQTIVDGAQILAALMNLEKAVASLTAIVEKLVKSNRPGTTCNNTKCQSHSDGMCKDNEPNCECRI